MKLEIDGWSDGGVIPARYAFGKPGEDGPFAVSDNVSPAVAWSGVPEGTRSLVMICHDADVPSVGDDVNQDGRLVPADLARVPFYHWVLVDIPVGLDGIEEGVASEGVTARGKDLGSSEIGVAGQNDYTGWFAGDADMEGVYGGYDGPCPPWNDSIVHHYHFTLYALDVDSLNLSVAFAGAEVLEAMEGRVLDSAKYMGTYSMNPDVVAG